MMGVGLSPDHGERAGGWRLAPVAHFGMGPSCGRKGGAPCRREGLVAREHVPDRLGELAFDVDPWRRAACRRASRRSGGTVFRPATGSIRRTAYGRSPRRMVRYDVVLWPEASRAACDFLRAALFGWSAPRAAALSSQPTTSPS